MTTLSEICPDLEGQVDLDALGALHRDVIGDRRLEAGHRRFDPVDPREEAWHLIVALVVGHCVPGEAGGPLADLDLGPRHDQARGIDRASQDDRPLALTLYRRREGADPHCDDKPGTMIRHSFSPQEPRRSGGEQYRIDISILIRNRSSAGLSSKKGVLPSSIVAMPLNFAMPLKRYSRHRP